MRLRALTGIVLKLSDDLIAPTLCYTPHMKKIDLQALHAYASRCDRFTSIEKAHLMALINEILKCWGSLKFYANSTYHERYEDEGKVARLSLPEDLDE